MHVRALWPLVAIAALYSSTVYGQSASPDVVVLAPATTLGSTRAADIRKAESVLAQGLSSVAGFRLIGPDEARSLAKRSKRPELGNCEGEDACLAGLGALAGARYAVHAEVGGLGDAHVVYLKLVDVAKQAEIRSTVLELAENSATGAAAKAAATQLLAPDAYVGFLRIATNVEGARAFLDGHALALADKPQPIFVGSHALRITHPEYSDFVRFVDIAFGETTELEATLVPLPQVSRSLARRGTLPGEPLAPIVVEDAPVPWYRKWYTVAGGAAAVAIVSGVIFGLAADGIDSDRIKQLR